MMWLFFLHIFSTSVSYYIKGNKQIRKVQKCEKISFKLGLLFLVFVLGTKTILFTSLYITLDNSRINEEFEQLLARGNSRRDVLEKN